MEDTHRNMVLVKNQGPKTHQMTTELVNGWSRNSNFLDQLYEDDNMIDNIWLNLHTVQWNMFINYFLAPMQIQDVKIMATEVIRMAYQ